MTTSEPITASRLLAWYDCHARSLPWRSPTGSRPPDPYRVWLSEVMLQQTTTAAVAPYYARFLSRWPTVEALAQAPDADVLSAWAGLGYYARARNLIAAARLVAERGGFPDTEAELRALPGVGAYIAAAVAAIAFGRRAVVVDANVERVVSRLFAINEPLPGARRAIRAATDSITPHDRAGDFAQAMMDLGATVCTPRDPRCIVCPLAEGCKARSEGAPSRYPLKPARKAKPQRRGTAWWIVRDGAVWLERRPVGGLLGGMRALPCDDWSARGDGSAVHREGMNAGTVSHSFTHFDLTLEVRIGDPALALSRPGEWWPLERLAEAGLPTVFRRAVERALAGSDDSAAEHQPECGDDQHHQAEVAPVIGARESAHASAHDRDR